MRSYIVLIITVSSIASASSITRGGCTSRDPLCWQDDGFDGLVYIANPKYDGEDITPQNAIYDDYEGDTCMTSKLGAQKQKKRREVASFYSGAIH